MKYAKSVCSCCGYYTLKNDVYGHYGEICEVCLWQSDEIQDNNPDVTEGFNPVSLNEAKENYKKFGAITEEYVKYAKKKKNEKVTEQDRRVEFYMTIENELFFKQSLAALILLNEEEINNLDGNIDYLGLMEKELFDKQSLAALILLIDRGHELDFSYNGMSYSLSWLSKSTKQGRQLLFSSSKKGETRTFEDMIDFIENGIIDGKSVLETWDDWILKCLL